MATQKSKSPNELFNVVISVTKEDTPKTIHLKCVVAEEMITERLANANAIQAEEG
jgi:hypothetical protein